MYLWKSVTFLIYLLIIIYKVKTDSTFNKRIKRTLTYPPPSSKIQMIYGIGLPVDLQDISVTFGYVIKAQYFLPINSTDYTQPDNIIERRKRKVHTRWHIYSALSFFLERFGGKSCVLKSICEIVSYELNRTHGFLEEIFYVLFRPSTTYDALLDPMDKEYFSAERMGKYFKGQCSAIYQECKISLIDMLTTVVN